MLNPFSQKWCAIKQGLKGADERSLFVAPGKKPVTQRQMNLYYYFLFIKDILKKNNARNVLEIGCGRGTLSLYLAKYLDLQPTLLDDSADAIGVAKDLFAENKCRADFFVRDALKTGFPDESFDAVVSIGLAEHFDNVEDLFKEQYRLIKNNGVIISLNIPSKFSIQFLNTITRATKKKDYYRNKLKPTAYKQLAEKAGFNNVSIVHVNPFPLYTPVSMSFEKRITKINRFILRLRNLFMRYPYKTNYFLSQAHFLVGYK